MSTLKSSAKHIATSSFKLLPLSVLQRLEHATRLAQGKGWGGGTVVDEVAAALSLLPVESRQHPVALDVGANIGAWTAAMLSAAPNATVYSFEPSAKAFGALRERFSGDRRVHLIRTAVGEAEGIARLWADSPGSSLGSLSQRRVEHFEIDFSYSEEVPILTLDSWHQENDVHPILLKMDVEGHEMAVLNGAMSVLERIKVVQFEFGGCNIDSRTYLQDFFYFFRDEGFRLYRLGPKGLAPLHRYTELDEAFTATNYFAQRH